MPERPETEVVLIQASQNGDTQAFESLVRKYQSLVCAITYSGTGRIDTSEELAQETLLLAWQNLHQLRDLERFPAWLARIARNAVQAWRRKRQRDVVDRAASLETAGDQAAPAFAPAETVIQREQASVIQQALEHVPEKYRLPLVLYYREHKSTQEVGSLLELSESAVRQRIARARNMLKDQVAAMVETTLERSRPGTAFTATIMAALGGATVKRTATAAALGKFALIGGGSGLTTILTGLGAKLLITAAGVALVAGGIFVVSRTQHQTPSATEPVVSSIPVSNEDSPDVATGVPSPMPENSVSNLVDPAPAADSIQNAPGTTRALATIQSTLQTGKTFSAFQPQGVLSGFVTDSRTGEPLAGVGIRFAGNSGDLTQTDANGFYSLPTIHRDGEYGFELHSATHLMEADPGNDKHVVFLKQGKQAVKHFTMRRGCRLRIQVNNKTGQPVEGADIRVLWLGKQSGFAFMGDVGGTTDPQGRLTIGPYESSPLPYRVMAHHKGYALGYRDIQMSDPNVISSTDLVLETGQAVHGFVEYTDGVPAHGIQIKAKPDWWPTPLFMDLVSVDAKGEFILPHITPGTYTLQANIPNIEDGGSAVLHLDELILPLPESELLTLTIPQASPQSLVSISGRFVWTSKEKPRFLRMMIESRDSGPGPVLSCPSNHPFKIDNLKPGTYTILCMGDNMIEMPPLEVTAPAEDVEIVLSYAGSPRLRGSVVYADTRQPVERFRARAIRQKLFRITGFNSPGQDQWKRCTGGQFDIKNVGPGIYRVQVMAEGYAPTLSPEINTDENNLVTVTLRQGGHVVGTVVDASGEPVSGAKVVPLSTARAPTEDCADVFASDTGAVQTSKGRFVLEHLAPGLESLKVTHPDYAPLEIKGVEVFEGDTTQCKTMVLEKGGTVTGRVYDVSGQPIADVVLFAQDHRGIFHGPEAMTEATRLGSTVTDANGNYRLDHLPAHQLCYVTRRELSPLEGMPKRACVPMTDKTIHVDLGGPTEVRGVLEMDGDILGDTPLKMSSPYSPHEDTLACTAQTDARGEFCFYGLPPGTYGLYYDEAKEIIIKEWRLADVIHIGPADTDLGTVPQGTTTLEVHLSFSHEDESQDGWWVRAQMAEGLMGQSIGNVKEPNRVV